MHPKDDQLVIYNFLREKFKKKYIYTAVYIYIYIYMNYKKNKACNITP